MRIRLLTFTLLLAGSLNVREDAMPPGSLLVAAVLIGPVSRKSATFEPDDRLLKVSEVCQLLGYSRATVYRFIALGKLPVVRVSGTIRFRYQSVLRWMADHETLPIDSSDENSIPPSAV